MAIFACRKNEASFFFFFFFFIFFFFFFFFLTYLLSFEHELTSKSVCCRLTQNVALSKLHSNLYKIIKIIINLIRRLERWRRANKLPLSSRRRSVYAACLYKRVQRRRRKISRTDGRTALVHSFALITVLRIHRHHVR